MSTLLKVMCGFSAIPINIPARCVLGMDELTLTRIWKIIETAIAKTIAKGTKLEGSQGLIGKLIKLQ